MLISCPECGEKVSNQADYCIHCGFPLKKIKSNEKENNMFTSNKYKLVLHNYGKSQIQLANVLCKLTNMNLTEIKSIIDSTPSDLICGLSKEKCYEIQEVLSTYGATVSIEIDYSSQEEAVTLKDEISEDMISKETILKDIEINSLKNPNYKPINNTPVTCPKCGCTNIQIVRKKFSLLTGFATNKVERVCANCLHKF